MNPSGRRCTCALLPSMLRLRKSMQTTALRDCMRVTEVLSRPRAGTSFPHRSTVPLEAPSKPDRRDDEARRDAGAARTALRMHSAKLDRCCRLIFARRKHEAYLSVPLGLSGTVGTMGRFDGKAPESWTRTRQAFAPDLPERAPDRDPATASGDRRPDSDAARPREAGPALLLSLSLSGS